MNLPGKRGNLYFSIFAANLATISVATHYSWTSPTLPKLEAPGSFIHLDSNEASWVGSLNSLGNIFGPFLGGWLIDRVGRRWTILIADLMNLLSWVVLLVATSVWHIYLGRFLGGFSGGILFVAIPVYVAEIAEPKIRGAAGTIFGLSLTGGCFIDYCFGPYVSYSTLIYVNFVPAFLFLILFNLYPESPYYLVRKSDDASATKSLTWLRNSQSPEEVQTELEKMKVEVHNSMTKKPRFSDLVKIRGNRKGLMISCVLAASQQLSGINVILVYTQSIFTMAGTAFSPSVSSIIVGGCMFAALAVSFPLTRVFGIKNMLVFSGIGMTIFQLSFGAFFYCSNHGYDTSAYWWWPLASVVGYILTYSVGFGPLPFTVMGEMFPSNIKGLASAITAGLACWFMSFLLTLYFNDVSQALGTDTVIFLFATFCLLAFLFTIFILPDTRGMTLEEILELLNRPPGARGYETISDPYNIIE
ncbi:facilitated trehalose transporter Tret1-like isoform X1 [Homalodisca vitripennis]|uniref:facilitated trehalose transporter Tret1-like isoform X1 n=1 Tax=Homalodisca vitripennis TaxID=197043 RepID=UPI001EEA67BD|nr:facilitated trehalose transporter Tret1-like isoform X1 [Homalodisca vitripennis]XP_046668438.1 facilitated trehalose transporter Tret1-like isoform X1 [Homalodisca vitripennis]